MNPCGKHATESGYGPIHLLLGNYAWVTSGSFYEADADDPALVNILAVGIKRGNRLLIAGKEIQI